MGEGCQGGMKSARARSCLCNSNQSLSVTQISIKILHIISRLHIGNRGPMAVLGGKSIAFRVWRPSFGSWQYCYTSLGILLGFLGLGLVICKMELIILHHRAIIGFKWKKNQ